MIIAEVVTVSFDITTKVEIFILLALIFFILMELIEIKNNTKRL